MNSVELLNQNFLNKISKWELLDQKFNSKIAELSDPKREPAIRIDRSNDQFYSLQNFWDTWKFN